MTLSKQLQEEPESEDRVHNTTQSKRARDPVLTGLSPASCVTWSELFLLSEFSVLLCNVRASVVMVTGKATEDLRNSGTGFWRMLRDCSTSHSYY